MLTPKQQRFVDEYLIDLNATDAAKRAGYSEKTARQQGAENLAKPVIAEAVAARKAARAKRTEITQDYVLTGLREGAELYGEGSSHSARIRALELLGKHMGMFAESVTVKGDKASPFTVEIVETVVTTREQARQAFVANGTASGLSGRDHPL